jgi:hypothetical protein
MKVNKYHQYFKDYQTNIDALYANLSGANHTVLWSGNGYYIYQPIEAFILEEHDIFSDFDQPSKMFLKFDCLFNITLRSGSNKQYHY